MPSPRLALRFLRGVLTLAIACAVALAAFPVHAGDFVFIRNAKNRTASVSRREIRQLFTGQTKQWGGVMVQAVIGDVDSPEFRYLSGIFGAEPRELLLRIKQEVFRGEMRRPIVARTATECIAVVGKHDGGIGIVAVEAAKALPADVERIPLGD
jgi:hypothetical protein